MHHSVIRFTFTKMVNLRNLLAKLKIRWINLLSLMQSYLYNGNNRLLDLIMIGGGIHPVPGAEPWKRNCLTLYRLLGFYQFIMALAGVGFGIRNHDDLVGLCASILLATCLATGYLKVYILKHYGEIIRQSNTFLSSHMAHSGDLDYDASVRQDAARTAGKVTLAVFLLICCDQVFISVPNSARDRIFGMPKQLHALGPMATRLMQEIYVFMFAVFWVSRYFCCSLTLLPVLTGLRSELLIVAHNYETIEDRVQAQVLEDQNIAAGTSRKVVPSMLRWKHLKQILGTTMELHVEVLRNIQLVQPYICAIYALAYYSSMVYVSINVLLVIRSGLTLISIGMILSSCFFMGECYYWCQLIESIEETMEKIADSAAQLGFRLEHSLENHSEYVQMRTSLMIVQLNASQSKRFSCGGIFPISVESFGDLCFVIYRFATFLLSLT